MDILAFIIIILVFIIIYLIKKFDQTFDKNKRFQLVDGMIEKKDYVGAIKYLEDLRKDEPDNIQIFEYLVSLYEKKKMYVRAVKCYDRLLELNHPENDHNKLMIFRKLADIYSKLGLYDKFYIENKKIVEIDHNDANALYDIGYFLMGTGNYDKAMEPLEKIVKNNPDNEKAQFMLGVCYMSKKWYKEAKECFDRIIIKNPDYGEAYFYLGYILKEYRSPESIKVFEDAISLMDNQEFVVKAAIATAVAAISQNLIDIAINILNKHLSYMDIEDNRRKDFLYNLGWAYFFKGDIEAALSNWEEVSSLDMNYLNIAEVMNPEVNRNFDEMERLYGIFSGNITFPTGREYIDFKKDYNISDLEQSLALWKQKMVAIAKERGVYMGPVRSSKVMATLTKIKFKNISHKIVNSLGYIVEKEFIYNEGVDFICYKRGTKKSDKTFIRIRNWRDVIQEDHIALFVRDAKASGVPIKNKTMIICGKYSKKAKESAEKSNIKMYDEKILTTILKKISDI